jgi:membrane peptidoglycan carboxypeptidase
MSYDEAMAVSSNVAAIRTGLATGRENFFGYAKKFGFGSPTGIELPAEANGILRSPKTWNGDSLASMSIGYEIGVSALQMATAYATIANDGVKVQPRIIKEIRQEGRVLSSTEAQKSQVVTPDTARYLKRMLREVVLKGTGRRAQINGYSAAGKTGTAWKYDEKLKRINENKYVSSFAGMAPFDKPSVVIVVVMDEPTIAARDGGQVAAPVFREIAEQILPELKIAPDAAMQPDSIVAEEIPSEIDPKAARQSKAEKSEKPVKESEKSPDKSAKQEKPGESKPAPRKENATPARDKNRKGKTARMNDRDLIFDRWEFPVKSAQRLHAASAKLRFDAPIFEYRAVAANAERPGVKT